MNKKAFFIVTMAILIFSAFPTYSQKKPNPFTTADSLASGNYKDVLTSFFQLAFDKLTGKEKELKFTSNPFAIMMRADPDLAVDTSYKKNRVLRNINFNFALKLDDNYKFNGFNSGINYAIINKRDYTIYDEFIDLVIIRNYEYTQLNKGIGQAITGIADTSLKNLLREQRGKMFGTPDFTFDKLDPKVRGIILGVINDSSLSSIARLVNKDKKANLSKSIREGYEEVKKNFQNRLLWTIGVNDTTYKDQLLFSNIYFYSQVLKGVINPAQKSNLEIDIRTSINLVDDTARSGRDLKRRVFRFEPGLNWVVKSRNTNLSMLELKFSGCYNHILNGMYSTEKKNYFTFNGTFRVRIINDIWIPLEFKYDPDSGNLLGFLSVRANFNGLGKDK
jgi:hypothetical protein